MISISSFSSSPSSARQLFVTQVALQVVLSTHLQYILSLLVLRRRKWYSKLLWARIFFFYWRFVEKWSFCGKFSTKIVEIIDEFYILNLEGYYHDNLYEFLVLKILKTVVMKIYMNFTG